MKNKYKNNSTRESKINKLKMLPFLLRLFLIYFLAKNLIALFQEKFGEIQSFQLKNQIRYKNLNTYDLS